MVVLSLLSLAFSVISLICWVLILIHAFQQSVGQGFLCLCLPCYIIYYMFAQFEHPKKGLIIAGFWLGSIFSAAVNVPAQMQRMEAMQQQGELQEYRQ